MHVIWLIINMGIEVKFNKIRVGFFHVSLVMDGRTLINQISQVRIKAAFRFTKAASASTFSFFFFFSRVLEEWTVAANVDFSIMNSAHFSTMNSASVHCSWTHKFHFSATFSLKIGLTILFTHLKIISLRCFQFSVFNFNKISSVQTNPKYCYREANKWTNALAKMGAHSNQKLSLFNSAPINLSMLLFYDRHVDST